MKGYKDLTVKKVVTTKNGINLSFKEMFIVLVIPTQNIQKHGLQNVKKGDVVAIKGRLGNEEHDLSMPNVLVDIKIIKKAQEGSLTSKKKLINAVLLFEKKVEGEKIKNIEFVTSTYYYFETDKGRKYKVDISANKVERTFNDISYD